MAAVLRVEHEGTVYAGLYYRLEAGNHIALGHPAYASELSVCGAGLVSGIDGGKIGEVTSPVEHAHKAVGHMLGSLTLNEDVLYEH